MGIRAAVFLLAALTASAQDPELAQAVKSPFDFARYIGSHANLDWPSLWRGLAAADHPQPKYLPRCVQDDDGPCSTELITVLDPSQVIVLVSARLGRDHYFRFLEHSGDWKFGGYYGSRKDPTQHGLLPAGRKTFLKISEKGTLGSDIYLDREDWFDLTDENFKPVFGFPVEGNINEFVFGIGRKLTGSAVAASSGAINLLLTVQFTFGGRAVGEQFFTATYDRPVAGGMYEIKSADVLTTRARINNSLFEDIADVASDLPTDDVLVYALPGLKEIASGKDAELKGSLKQMLIPLRDSPEKQTLLNLLDGH